MEGKKGENDRERRRRREGGEEVVIKVGNE